MGGIEEVCIRSITDDALELVCLQAEKKIYFLFDIPKKFSYNRKLQIIVHILLNLYSQYH